MLTIFKARWRLNPHVLVSFDLDLDLGLQYLLALGLWGKSKYRKVPWAYSTQVLCTGETEKPGGVVAYRRYSVGPSAPMMLKRGDMPIATRLLDTGCR